MDEIQNDNGYWMAVNRETDTRQCHQNLSDRIYLLSESPLGSMDEWNHISGYYEENQSRTTVPLCLCGMLIHKYYYIMNVKNRNLVQIGSKCLERINPELIKRYENSLLIKGCCYCCEKGGNPEYFDNLEKHYLGKRHASVRGKLMISGNQKLKEFCSKHIVLTTTRKCIRCPNRIKNTEPLWKEKCISCYLKTKPKPIRSS